MKKILSYIFLLFLTTEATAQNVETDRSFRTGKLPNGLTYYIRHNAKEAGLADFYIAQRVGSILEEPRQRGLAHFLEHMAFNGTQNFRDTPKSPSIVHWCEAHGIKFGTNLNAYTSVDETVYHVGAVPVRNNSTVDSTLLILHDWSHYLLLTDKEIDKERGVIHEEWRTRRAGMATQRMMENALPIIYKGSKYEDCLPIGSMDIVDHFPYKDLRDYYHKWYRPDLQAIIVVGDIDVDAMEKKIKDVFGPIPMPKNAAKREYFSVPDNDKMIVASLKDAEQPIMLVNLYMKRDAAPDTEKNTLKYQRDAYLDDLVSYIVGERLNEVQESPSKPCLSASAHIGQFLVSRSKEAFTLSFGARQENIRGSFDATVGCIEQIRQHGFTQSELDRAKAFYLKVVNNRFNQRDDRRNSYFVRKAQNNFLNNEPITTEAYDKQLAERFDREVTLKDVNAAMREAITNRNQVLVVYAPEKADFHIPTDAELESYVLEAQARKYPAYEEKKVDTKLIEKLPNKGRIVSQKAFAHGTTELTLSNGVKVYFKPTDFNKDQVTLRFFGEGGSSLYPDADIPNIQFLATAIKEGGLGKFDKLALNKYLSDKTVRINANVGAETQSISGQSSVKDVKTLFELAHLYFTDLRRDDQAFGAELNRMRSFLTNREASPKVGYNDSLSAIVYGNSPRTQPVKATTIDKVNYDRVLQIYHERFSNASNFKLIVMGNISLETLRPLLEQYIASLPSTGKKETFADTYPNVRNCNETHRWTKKMNTPISKVSIIYTWNEPYSAKSDLQLDMFRRVLSIAYVDSVREDKGGVYGVSLSSSIDKYSNPRALLKVSFDTDPDKYEMVMPIIYRQIEHIAQSGPAAASLKKVKEYLLKQYDQAVITNDYWSYVLYNQLRYGVDFDKNYKQLVEKTTAADVQRIAKNMLQSKRRIEVTMLSEK